MKETVSITCSFNGIQAIWNSFWQVHLASENVVVTFYTCITSKNIYTYRSSHKAEGISRKCVNLLAWTSLKSNAIALTRSLSCSQSHACEMSWRIFSVPDFCDNELKHTEYTYMRHLITHVDLLMSMHNACILNSLITTCSLIVMCIT